MAEYIVDMQGIYKSFGANNVLKGVDFKLKKGSIHALLGENGTGKSTLMNILSGILPFDDGKIKIFGEDVNPYELKKKLGITFIHQELALVNDLTIMENMFLGKEEKRGIFLNKQFMLNKTNEVLGSMGMDLDPMTKVGDLNASCKQIIEIAKALLKESNIIIMDEPTTALTDVEIQHVFEIMRSLKKQGVSLIFISHKLNEVLEICDSYTIMRDGNLVSNGEVNKNLTEHDIAKSMVGKELLYDELYKERKLGDTILELKNLTKENQYKNVNMHVNKGEILGVTGLLGDGRSELFSTVFGANRDYEGEIKFCGKNIDMKSTDQATKIGITYVPRDRKEIGIIKDLSVSENMNLPIMKNLKEYGLLSKSKEKENNNKYVNDLNIKVSDLQNKITSLSGGNQQKVIIARALGSSPKLVILDNPTQGVDVGAKLEIYSIIMELAKEGVSFVVLSSEAQEIMMICDRIYIMFHGEVKGELDRCDITEENIMVIATGGSLKMGEKTDGK